jgi:hypothetical protein
MRFLISLLLICSLFTGQPLMAAEQNPESDKALQNLATKFFEWRRIQQPVTGDDIPRVERPDGWVPNYSSEALQAYREGYRAFTDALGHLDRDNWSLSDQVDAKILEAAIERVHWELDVLKSPQRNPLFYIDQTLGSVFELLVLSSPMTDRRAENIILRLEHIPTTLEEAQANLQQPVRPFAQAAIGKLENVGDRLRALESALSEVFPAALAERLKKSIIDASFALTAYSDWLHSKLDTMRTAFAVGPVAYQWFLSHVALIPHSPDELLAQGRQAWNQAVALDVVEQNRNRDLPEMSIFESADHQIRASLLKENEVRKFLESNNLMTVPDWLMHYRFRPMPDYLAPLAFMGVNDDLTSETRLGEDAYRYIKDPSYDLGYFELSMARDPRPIIIHEGVPGHYFQMALSWAHPNPIRRRFIDSAANEGIAFYVEELLMRAGLFDFSPRSREIIYSYMRLRALRVEIDIRLAVGDFTIEQAGEYLARAVPMDRETAVQEAVFFAFNPGQAISYQIGKLQILRFLADAKLDQADEFSLRHFHDYLMLNGNVPIALQRWEYLDRDDDVLRLDVLGGKPVTVPQ